MHIESYFAITKEWEKRYGKPSRAFKYDLTEARLCCEKCGKFKKKMSRHHIGNDFFFAQMLPDVFAARYIEFRREDTAKLCDDCHKKAHRLYKTIMADLWRELNAGGQRIITKEWCEGWMERIRTKFRKWVLKPPRKKKRKHKRSLPTKREV